MLTGAHWNWRSKTPRRTPPATRTYPATAKGVPAAESLSAQAAAELVASFVNPALAMSSNPAAWDPHAMAWIPDTSGPAKAPADA
jgi:hypothetical protein